VNTAVTITIRGEPVAKGRPRFVRKTGIAFTNEIVVTDDSMIVDLVVTKKYATVPALTITVTPLPALTAQGRSAA